ncbi:MAG: isochorismatase family protein, partial [Bacteroidales bacterium]|nr:isochorismatase family protein [Bacteroidales bacterium]
IIRGRVCKNTFGSVDLANLVKTLCEINPIDEVILMGVCTDICVISNAVLIKAYCPEMLVTVDASCCAGVTPESHKAALTTMKMCQINVIGE